MSQHKRVRDAIWPIGVAVSVLWALVLFLRRRLFGRRFVSRLPVLCIGNLHSGGSGKTPLVAEIVKCYGPDRIVVITRGYGGRQEKSSVFIDPSRPDGAEWYGDEAWWLAVKHRARVLVGRGRESALRRLEKECPYSAVILDDGFQHLAVKAQVSLILFKTSRRPTDSFCLPWGDLREPFSALKDASGVVFVTDEASTGLADWLHFFEHEYPLLEVFVVREVSDGLWEGDTRLADIPSKLGGFCGIAVPEAFIRSVQALGGEMLGVFPDHHPYGPRDIARLLERQKERNVNCLVTTEKDWVKVRDRFSSHGVRLLTLRIHHEIPSEFWYFLGHRWAAQ